MSESKEYPLAIVNPKEPDTLDELTSASLTADKTFQYALAKVNERREAYLLRSDEHQRFCEERSSSLANQISELEEKRANAKAGVLAKFSNQLETYVGESGNSFEMTAFKFLIDSEIKKAILDRFGKRTISSDELNEFVSQYIYDAIKDEPIFTNARDYVFENGLSNAANFYREKLKELFDDVYSYLKKHGKYDECVGIRQSYFNSSTRSFDRPYFIDYELIGGPFILFKVSSVEDFPVVVGKIIDYISTNNRDPSSLSISTIFYEIREVISLFHVKNKDLDIRKKILADFPKYICQIKFPFTEIDLGNQEELDNAYLYIADAFVKQLDKLGNTEAIDRELAELNREFEKTKAPHEEYDKAFNVTRMEVPDLSNSELFTDLLVQHAKNAVIDNVHRISGKSPEAARSESNFIKTIFEISDELMAFIKEEEKNQKKRFK